jgi:hypothetical protein
MKIHQLPMGARFEYAGQAYVKSGPLVATGPDGQRLIPKYAVLKVLDGSVPKAAVQATPLSRESVLAALADYHATCATLIPQEQSPALDAARAAFLKAIE